MSEGCWKCEAPASGLWDHCQRCGALSVANVEAVCRGVASCAARPDTSRVRTSGELVWLSTCGSASTAATHPTRHGAARAAFDAAWKAGVERLMDDVSVTAAVLWEGDSVIGAESVHRAISDYDRVYGELWPEHDAETIRQWCEETGAEWICHPGYVALDFAEGGSIAARPGEIMGASGRWLRFSDPVQGTGLRLQYSGVPDHVADAMVREAKRALGAKS